jgi:hypothetical protein
MWTAEEQAELDALTTPSLIQAWLNRVPYDAADGGRSVRETLRRRTAHCFGGALFAAHCLQRIGCTDVFIVNLDAVRDDGHILCVYVQHGHWGAIAKSNFNLLRSREPIYPSLKSLVLSYFEFYFNSAGEKTLLSYTDPLRLQPAIGAKGGGFSAKRWLFASTDLDDLQEAV